MQVSNNIDPWLCNTRDNCVFLETAVLNTLDKTIVFTMLSGNIREAFAVIQGIASLVFAADYAHRSMSATGDERVRLQENAWFCVDMTKHAVLNYGRAKVASYHKVATIFAAVALMVYDWKLDARQKYSGEAESPVQNWVEATYTLHVAAALDGMGAFLKNKVANERI